ncbi:hypothetical protein [Veillonella sp.]|uniref:hypothetical protein n=1 Tax=Veillonella sp. TaxID=1926307 RepID=UPI0028FF94EE|nr:hypothetical protein [Veillonella sp.]MDU2868120.1 hypothetical protein [Veillonella sp.]
MNNSNKNKKMNKNCGQDKSSIELWKTQQVKVLSNDSTAVDYFCISKSILNNIVIEKIKNEIYEYIHDLKVVLDEPYLIFKESGVAYFGNEKRIVPLESNTDKILFIDTKRSEFSRYIGYRIGNGYKEIDKFIIELKNFINEYTTVGDDLTVLLKKIDFNPILNYFKNNNLIIPDWLDSLLNNQLLTESSKSSNIILLELKNKYIAIGTKERISADKNFNIVFSKRIHVKTFNDFTNYVIRNLCEPNHVKLSKYDNKYFGKLKSFVLDNKIKNIFGNIDVLVNGILKYYKKELQHVKNIEDYKKHLGGFNVNDIYELYINELKNCDLKRANISPYTDDMLEDINNGHWNVYEAFADEYNANTYLCKVPKNKVLVARNPLRDVNMKAVCGIDFGTKSTVVVCHDKDDKLLRVGASNFLEEPRVEDYENPTVIHIIDYEHFINNYKSSAGRPNTEYKDLQVSHDAAKEIYKTNFDKTRFYSVFSELKQWANSKYRNQILQDYNGKFINLKPYLSLEKDDFDPIEIYAYFLGLNINNMHTGIYIKYLLSFPVNYELAVRNKIIESFERGLKKSLPNTVLNDADVMKRFKVSIGGSEPASYAITALNSFGVEPLKEETSKVVSYGVFDFGGGTTDFDFGIEYIPDSIKYKFEIEQLGSGGDVYLGGENLLNVLAFEVYKNNLDILRKEGIPIVIPPKSQAFSGSEVLIKNEENADQSSYLNLKLIAYELRDLWEEANDYESKYNEDTITIKLFSVNGEEKTINLRVNLEVLQDIIRNHIRDGIDNFFNTYLRVAKQYKDKMTSPLHILLAGNSCKSRILQEEFVSRIIAELNDLKMINGGKDNLKPIFKLYPPLGTKFNIEVLKKLDVVKNSPFDLEKLLFLE